MQWIITADHINGKTPNDTPSRVGKMCCGAMVAVAMSFATPDQKLAVLEKIKGGMNFEFRLFDDDGELYYEGLCKDLDQMDGEQAFAPLDWAANDAGCTTMKHRKVGAKRWEIL